MVPIAPDWLYRFIYRHGVRAARLVWWFTRPRTTGAHVMIWCDGKVVLVRTSYRKDWMAPGGGLKRGETHLEGAVREVAEEVGLILSPEDLRLVHVVEHRPDYRRDRLHLFETHLATLLPLQLDNREVVEARWVTREEALSLHVTQLFRDYLNSKAD